MASISEATSSKFGTRATISVAMAAIRCLMVDFMMNHRLWFMMMDNMLSLWKIMDYLMSVLNGWSVVVHDWSLSVNDRGRSVNDMFRSVLYYNRGWDDMHDLFWIVIVVVIILVDVISVNVAFIVVAVNIDHFRVLVVPLVVPLVMLLVVSLQGLCDELLELLIVTMFLTVSVTVTVTSVVAIVVNITVVSIVVGIDVAVASIATVVTVAVASRIDNNDFGFPMMSSPPATGRAIDREVKVKVHLRGLGHEGHATREKSCFKHFQFVFICMRKVDSVF